MPVWGWVLVGAATLVGLAFLSILAITFLGRSSETRFEPVDDQIDAPGGESPFVPVDPGGTFDPEVFGDDDPDRYGDDAALDRLWDQCDEGDGGACDDLYWESPLGSEYEAYGNTCGERFAFGEQPYSCAEELGSGGSSGT